MVLLNLSNSHLFWQGKEPEPIEQYHRPYFLAWPDGDEPVHKAHERLLGLANASRGKNPDDDSLAKILEIREPERYNSFWNAGQHRDVIPVATKRPYWTPEISDALFFKHGFHTAEHDIPYVERASADLAADRDWWMFDTKGRKATLRTLTYDIETTQYGKLTSDLPIDIIGWAEFDVEYEAHKDLDTESFDFRFHHMPNDWADREVHQLVAHNRDQELDNLMEFTERAVRYDLVSGHNLLGFDNKQIHDRILDTLKRDRTDANLSPKMRAWFEKFTSVWSRPDRSFHFGSSQDICVWHPVTVDTYHAARKFFFFHDDFTLKGLAPWLGIKVPDRVHLEVQDMKLDPRTLEYNKHDINEQVGLTQILLAQALPLAFTVNLPMTDLLTGGNTKMWDHMSLIRARKHRKIMPATCRAQGVARQIHKLCSEPFPTRRAIAEAVRALPPDEQSSSSNKEILRVAKQGDEMPFWCETPGVVIQKSGTQNGYAIVGGMTLKPDGDLKSHFVPWFHVVAADVGAMYPTILKARNLTADTVRPAEAGETADDELWLFELDEGFANSKRFQVRPADAVKDRFTKGRGWMVGVKHAPTAGLVNLAMTGILDTIQKVKNQRAEAKRSNAPADELRIHDMTYASLKAARNAGTHGILVAVNVSCRQFNVWGGANITTIGQRILHGTLEDFEARKIRVVYGDTDGIYIGCSKSAGNLPHLAAALDADVEPEANKWITLPHEAYAAVKDANTRWRAELNYEGFELEAETHDGMVFVVHKNYLIFDAKGDKVVMETKGNNFKGSDKAPLAQHLLADIMKLALKEVASWDDEEKARIAMQTAIKRATRDVMKNVHIDESRWNELILRQSVNPVKSYETNPDGTLRVQAVRTAALEQVIGEPINVGRKFRFIVCKEPLPLYKDPNAEAEARERLQRSGHQLVVKAPSKKGLKPIEHMWPVEHVQAAMVDWAWYKSMVEDYVKGAFGFDSLELAIQRDLSSWF